MKTALCSMMLCLCFASQSFGQVPPVQNLPMPGTIAAITAATVARTNASTEISNASSMRGTLTFGIAQLPSHWDYFNANILFSTTLTNAQVIDAMQICVDIDNDLADANTELALGNPLLVTAITQWFTGDARYKTGQYTLATLSFTAAQADAIAAKQHYIAGMLALTDAIDKFDLLVLYSFAGLGM